MNQNSLILELCNARLIILFNHLNDKYILQNPTSKYSHNIKNLFDKFQFVNLQEINGNSGTAYTIDKKYIYICLRERVTPNKIYNINSVMFVLLHEITHLTNDTWDHTPDFWILFKFYLQEAIECGVYIPIDYSVHNEVYCKSSITYSPLYDDSIVV